MRGWWKIKIDVWDDDKNDLEPDDSILDHIAEQIKEGCTGGQILQGDDTGWWDLDINIWNKTDRDTQPNNADLNHIAEGVKEGCVEGEIVHEE